MKRVAVLIPGMMGSSLSIDVGTSNPDILWDDDFRTNYRLLLQDPKRLVWTGKTADASVMREAHAGWWAPKYKLWNRTIEYLDQHNEFSLPDAQLHFGYDWRQSLLESSDLLHDKLTVCAGHDVALEAPYGSDVRFVVIAHSMGGVLARVAIGLGKLDPSWINKMFLVGSPLRGAPQAFHSLYGDIAPLPLFITLVKLFRGRNQQRFLSRFRECLQSFPSAYQLLPHVDWWYLFYGPSDRRNALGEGVIPLRYREHAREAHEAIKDGTAILERAKVPVFAIFTKVHFKAQTEIEYRVTPNNASYSVDEVLGRSVYGDGTVPMESARDTLTRATRCDLESVDHLTMCHDSKVVARLAANIN